MAVTVVVVAVTMTRDPPSDGPNWNRRTLLDPDHANWHHAAHSPPQYMARFAVPNVSPLPVDSGRNFTAIPSGMIPAAPNSTDPPVPDCVRVSRGRPFAPDTSPAVVAESDSCNPYSQLMSPGKVMPPSRVSRFRTNPSIAGAAEPNSSIIGSRNARRVDSRDSLSCAVSDTRACSVTPPAHATGHPSTYPSNRITDLLTGHASLGYMSSSGNTSGPG